MVLALTTALLKCKIDHPIIIRDIKRASTVYVNKDCVVILKNNMIVFSGSEYLLRIETMQRFIFNSNSQISPCTKWRSYIDSAWFGYIWCEMWGNVQRMGYVDKSYKQQSKFVRREIIGILNEEERRWNKSRKKIYSCTENLNDKSNTLIIWGPFWPTAVKWQL